MWLLGKMSPGKGHLVRNMGFWANMGLFTGKKNKKIHFMLK